MGICNSRAGRWNNRLHMATQHLFGLDFIYLAVKHILYISFSIGICLGGRNSKAPTIANTCSLQATV